MKMIPTLMEVEALAKATVFLLSIWTITAEIVHSKESALIRDARETEMGFTRIVNHASCSVLCSLNPTYRYDQPFGNQLFSRSIHICDW